MKTSHLFYHVEKGILFLFLILLFTRCEKDQQLNIPSAIQVSQGTYLGVVHLSWDATPGAQYYNLERQDPVTGDWVSAGTTSNTVFDDYGFNLPDNVLVFGQHYRYRISAGSADESDSEYTESGQEGWAYDPQQVTVSATIEANEDVTVSWTEKNPLDQLVNYISAAYTISRKNDASTVYTNIGTVNNDTVFLDNNPGDNPEYKVEAKYHYEYENMDYGTFESITIMISEATQATGSGGPGTVTFTRSDMGTVTSSDGIPVVMVKTYAGVQYLGMLKDADAAGKGVPGIYALSGSTWQEKGAPYPDDLLNETSLGHIDFAVDGNNIYLAGLSYDSLYMFTYDGASWSANMTMNNLGQDGSPSGMAIEMVDGTLYMAVTLAPDFNLKVLKWNGAGWTPVGGDANGWIETGEDIFYLGLQQIDGLLYLSYMVKNSDFNSTVKIVHLNAGAWSTDVEWTADNIIGLAVAGNTSSQLYFITHTQNQAVYPGGVYKVTSSTTVDHLITATDTWFLDPYSITVDTNGEVFLVNAKLVSASELYPVIYTYSGNNWSALSGDFSDGTTPVSIRADGTTIYYVYGDASNLTTWYDPKSVKSASFTK